MNVFLINEFYTFQVCLNFAKHLRGNTYIEYKYLKDAVKAFTVFHGRWFGGKQISLEFCSISSWRQAICGKYNNYHYNTSIMQ